MLLLLEKITFLAISRGTHIFVVCTVIIITGATHNQQPFTYSLLLGAKSSKVGSKKSMTWSHSAIREGSRAID